MKLGELRKSIREFKGNPTMTLLAPPGAKRNMNLVVQKTVLMEELGHIFPDGKAAETDMEFNSETGVISCPSVDMGTGSIKSDGRAVSEGVGEDRRLVFYDDEGNVRFTLADWPEEGEIMDAVGVHSPKPVVAEKGVAEIDTVDETSEEAELDLDDDLESLDDIPDDDDDLELDIDLDDE